MKNIMNRLLLAFALSTTIPLTSGCAAIAAVQTVAQVVEVANKPVDKFFNTLVDEKAYFGLLSGEKYLNQLAGNAVDLGLLKAGSPEAIKIADLLLNYKEVSLAAQKAKHLNDASSVMDKVRAGKALYSQILLAVGRFN